MAFTVLLIGMAAIMSMYLTAQRASAYARHAAEAAVLAEDRVELLRTVADPQSGQDRVNATGTPDDDGLFERVWVVSDEPATTTTLIVVTVSWLERGSELHSIVYRTRTSQ